MGSPTMEEKPRSRILAEYLAHGYVVGDAAIQRAIELDHKHGVTTRFMNTLTHLDQKFHATDRAKAADQSYGITNRATSLFSGLTSYFEKASNTPTGKKLVKFYTDGQRQVQDIHAEAQRLMELKKEEHGGSSYKASGLERVFGKEKEKTGAATTEPCKFKKSQGQCWVPWPFEVMRVLPTLAGLKKWIASNPSAGEPAQAAVPAPPGDGSHTKVASDEKA
ncbi:hypothetical protein NUW58_g5423 [Xylaria curta]|uniref:Uncharacterized protein n=1 Tax=Xylaria curta TaxID=42375 RepID=A0ACC1P2E5_9PEZI|nr:hypothetical protein NUW58_g5423 [Xylaria curta]